MSLRSTELDRTRFPEWRDTILAAPTTPPGPRSYPGYPSWPLGRRGRVRGGLLRALAGRRCVVRLAPDLPSRRELSALLGAAHGVTGTHGRGPAPSAGCLQAIELYPVVLEQGWLPAGAYHYDRAGHHLSQLAGEVDRARWGARIPSLERIEGGALVLLLVGDGARARGRYGMRGLRFLLLEAGHVMQNLCLVSQALGLCTIPLGGLFEREIEQALGLLPGDACLYGGICGRPC